MTENTKKKKTSWEVAEVEYGAALEQYRHYTGLRRQDMAFVTTVQIAVFTIIGAGIQDLNLSTWVLSVLAFFVSILGLNSEIRLSAYMMGYKERAKQLEEEHNLNVVRAAISNVKKVEKSSFFFSNRKLFPFYYLSFGIIWIIVWIYNFVR